MLPIIFLADVLLLILIPIRGEFVGVGRRLQTLFVCGIIAVVTVLCRVAIYIKSPMWSLEKAFENSRMQLEWVKNYGWESRNYGTFTAMTAVFLVVLAAFCVFGAVYAVRLKSPVGFWSASASLVTILVQCATYILGQFGYAMYVIFPLPLYSYGGASFAVNMLIVGVMLSAFVSDVLYRGDVRRSVKIELKIEKT